MGAESDRLLTERLAGEALGVDDIWIAGGHSHDTVAEAHDNIHISQNNKNIRYATVADIEVRDSTIVAIRYEQINTATITPSTTMEQRIEELKASDPELNTIEGFATATATKDGVANFTVEALTSYPYADNFVPENPSCVRKYCNLARILGVSNMNEVTTIRALISYLHFLNAEMGIPAKVSDACPRLTETEYLAALDDMATAALADSCTSTNPRTPSKEEVMEIYKKIW